MIACKDGRCGLQGPITVDNVVSLLGEGREQFTASPLTVDLSAVTDVDSSALSLLLEWRRDAARAGRSLRYTGLPGNLQSLAKLYGVTELLTMNAE
jgi:phospholipid transport system transporter-binding protein